MRVPVNGGRGHSTPHSFPAPIRGWVENDNPALPQPGGAAVLENFMPTQTGIRMRGGCAQVGTVPGPVQSLHSYDDGTDKSFFAATATGLYKVDASGPVSAGLPDSQSGDWSGTQFASIGGSYLYLVNGVDEPRLFDGTIWSEITATSSPFSLAGKDGPWSNVFVFKSRLFFIKENSMTVHFLPVGAVGGELSDLNMSGVFQRGGKLLFGASWSSDSGSGFGDRCVLCTDRGEIAVYEGSDPASASDWRLVGRYDVTPPLGKDAYARVGGDLIIATLAGLVPISGVVRKDPIALESIAISRPIARSWQRSATLEGTGWRVVRWVTAGVILVLNGAEKGSGWGVAAETGAWFKIKGWDMPHAIMHGSGMFFAGSDGSINRGDTTGRDGDTPIVGRYRGLMEAIRGPRVKAAHLARSTWFAQGNPSYSLAIIGGRGDNYHPSPVPWPEVPRDGLWDNGVWDKMQWDSGFANMRLIEEQWRGVAEVGSRFAPEVQVVSDGDLPIACELLSVDCMFSAGAIVA